MKLIKRSDHFGIRYEPRINMSWVSKNFKKAAGVLLLLSSIAVPSGQGATIQFFLNISGGLFSDPGFTSPLPAGSLVYVIATPDQNAPPDPQSAGSALIGDSTPPDDVIIATLFLNEIPGGPGSGTHADPIGFSYDPADFPSGFSHVYLRFFDFDSAPPVGEDIAWGHSDVFEIPPTGPFGLPGFLNITNQYYTDRTNDFVIIPEPGTLHLILLAGGVLFGIWRRKRSV